MGEKIRKLAVINWVVISIIAALGCIAIVVIAKVYGPQSDQPAKPAETTAPVTPEGTSVPALPEMPADDFHATRVIIPMDELNAGPLELEKYLMADLDPLVRWRRQVGEVRSHALTPDGGILVWTKGQLLFSLAGDGEVRWSKSYQGDWLYGPVVDPAGNIFAGERQKIHAYAPDGSELWEFTVPGVIVGGMVLDSRGNLIYKGTYLKSEQQFIMALTPEGEERWVYDAEYELAQIPPRSGTKGRVYDMGKGGVFQTITHAGTRGWGLGLQDKARGPDIDSLGRLYVATAPFPEEPWTWLLHCLDPKSGWELWNAELPNYPQAGPVVTQDGRVYMLCRPPSSNGLLPCPVLAYDPEGEKLWETGFLSGQSLVCPDNPKSPLAVVTYDGAYILDPRGEVLFSLGKDAGHPVPLAINPGQIAFCAGGGELVALDLSTYSE